MRGAVWTVMVVAALAGALPRADTVASQPKEPFAGVLDEHPVIRYADAAPRDPVARLRESLRAGARTLAHHDKGGYLRAVLDALDISPSSQLLVFSKTGIQRTATGPRTPRALYFNDRVVVGYIDGARVLEIAAHDPVHGVIFYTLDQGTPVASAAAAAPDLTRRTNCLTCHVSANTLEVPGVIARSMFTSRGGEVLPQLGSFLVDHRTPIAQRWGGWFVTLAGAAPDPGIRHMGNVGTDLDPATGAVTGGSVLAEWLAPTAGSSSYPSRHSDLATLLVFDHQMHAMNLLTRLNWETRVAESERAADFSRGDLAALADDVVDYFLFVDEAPLPGRLAPRPEFVEHFAARGSRDRRGRSLRDLDLSRRLFRHPCSYMIASEAFNALPRAAATAIYDRLGRVLTGADTRAKYAHLTAADRGAILEILRDTQDDLPASLRGPARR